MKSFNENSESGLGGNDVAGTIRHDGTAGKAFGYPYFKCDNDTFNNCLHGRNKHKRWENFTKNKNLSDSVRTFVKNNKGTKFLFQNERSGEFVFADKKFQ